MVIEHESNGVFQPIVQDNNNTPANTSDDIITIAPAGTDPVAAKAVDVNGDGWLDIVVAYSGSNNITTYLNQGNGVFYKKQFDQNNVFIDSIPVTKNLSLVVSPTDIAVGDFTGSSAVDVAILSATTTNSTISLASGDGTGAFTQLDSSTSLDLPLGALKIVAADINGAGGTDLFAGFDSGSILI
jgi:hypothetical protein